MVSIFNLTPMQVAVIAAIIGLAFALPLTTDEDGVFGNVLDLAAEMVFIIGLQRVLIKNAQTAEQTAAQTAARTAASSAANLQRQIDELSDRIAKRSASLKQRGLLPPGI